MKSTLNRAEVTSYRKSKSSNPTRKGFGLMLGCSLRDRWVTKDAKEIVLDLEGGPQGIRVRLRDGFWNKCPEFLADEVYDWIIGQGLPIPWPNRQPHLFALERITGTHFRAMKQSI